MKLLEQNPDKIDWDLLSMNPNAMILLEQNQDKIHWVCFSCNISIFEKKINYQFLDERMSRVTLTL